MLDTDAADFVANIVAIGLIVLDPALPSESLPADRDDDYLVALAEVSDATLS